MDQSFSLLNQAQRQAVFHRDGPLLVLAGAGAGKTRTIACRIAQLIRTGTKARQILAVTFTNKAAREMLGRVVKLNGLAPQEDQPFIATFHALGASLLRENGKILGLNRHFSIADQDDSLALIKAAAEEAGLDRQSFNPRRLGRLISREKARGLNLNRYQETAADGFWPRLILAVWERYEKKLRRLGTLDFDDLLLSSVALLRRRPEILNHYRERWPYLLIDEYQDTNFIQYELARLLAGPRQNICAVGDLDQAIYSWRGADCRHLLGFAEDYPGATIITLEENYRSTPTILAAANQIIAKNLNRPEKNLFTRRASDEKIRLLAAANEEAEAGAVAAEVSRLIAQGTSPAEIALLYRANFQSRALEEAMLQSGLPYRVLGVRFFDRREVKDILAYLKAALNSEDLISFRRAIATPARGLGKVALVKIMAGQSADLPNKQQNQFKKFQGLLAEIARRSEVQPVSQVLDYLILASGLKQSLASGGPDDRERLENLLELRNMASKYDNLPPVEGTATLLAEAALVSDQDTLNRELTPAVNLMTVHAAKGLEFDQVFVTGLEQGLFPHQRLDAESDPDYDEEEERRLFYVALTRARDKLHLSYAETRGGGGGLPAGRRGQRLNQPSEFLSDLNPDLFEETIYVQG